MKTLTVLFLLLLLTAQIIAAQDSTFFDVAGWDKNILYIVDKEMVIFQRVNLATNSIAYQAFYKREERDQFAYLHIRSGSKCYFRSKQGESTRDDRVYVQIPCVVFSSIESTYIKAVNAYWKAKTKDISKLK